MPDLKMYVGCKIIKAEPMDEATFLHIHKNGPAPDPDAIIRPGYHVEYPDQYHSWSPKRVFEEAYRLISLNEWVLMQSAIEGG